MSDTNFYELIEEQVKEAFELKEDTNFNPCSLGLLEEALSDLGYYLGDDLETNGWEQDFWVSVCDADNKPICRAYGSMYYGTLKLDFNIN